MIWVAFGVGLFVGTFLGILTIGLCQMGARTWRTEEFSFRSHCQNNTFPHPVHVVADGTK